MIKKAIILFVIFVTGSTFSFCQEHNTVLNAPDTWISEIIPFPIGFAREIDFTGFEDLRFAPGWNDSTSSEFWTYTFVWYIDNYGPMTEEKLTEVFNLYYDGLMGVTDPKLNLKKTISVFSKTGKGFTGEMQVYDHFFTKKYMTLNIIITESFCPADNIQIILCDISPKPLEHPVWEIFKQVKVKGCS